MNLTDAVFLREFRDNWPILVAAFLCLMFAFSAPSFALPFLYVPIVQELGWTREEVTLLATAKYAAGAIAAIVVGRFVDIIGVRRGLILLSILGGIAMLSFLWVPNHAAYYFVGVMLGVAGTGTIVAIKVLISRSFHASQATAMAVAMLGSAMGATATPLIIVPLIDEYGWREAAALFSLGIWAVALPLLIYGLRDTAAQVTPSESSGRSEHASRLVARLIRDRQFWFIGLAVFSAAVVDQAFTQHQVLFLELDLGMSAQTVAAGVFAMGLVGLFARIGVGCVFDRMSSRGVSLMYLTLAAAASIALFVLNPIVFMMFIVLRAVGHAAVLLDSTVLAKHVYGVKNLGLLLGIYTSFVAVGFAVGPWLVGRLFEVTGSYVVPFIVCVFIALFAAIVLLPVRPAYWLANRHEKRQAPESAQPVRP